ncbi:uncharacterized protein A4U43_C07F3200 [Asparagus officinalis]|uniref:Protein kinase domain-containing protein n=1 Tax=Asparagus officinalis TaxID=4686 RepID=A0A5P1E946_ASPOF|nr:uncharacterized protein A4U43_C07F3200 [Asparagus officinalis]
MPARTRSRPSTRLDPPELYQTARVFVGPSSYSFSIQEPGRHFVRLYFFPFQSKSFNLTNSTFSVTTQGALLLNDFQPSPTAVLKEFLLNVTDSDLIVSFVPSESSTVSFVNALEVVSVPDDLIPDSVQAINPVGNGSASGNYKGLLEKTLETVYRINMGGPKVFPNNDTLSRTWFQDEKFLLDPNLSQSKSFSGQISYMQGVTREDAPDIVYATCTELAPTNASTDNAIFNVTWKFDVDASSLYFVRMHFCDIVSIAAHNLLFDVYIGTQSALNDFDISSLTLGSLATAVYQDFVVPTSEGTTKLTVSIGPSIDTSSEPDGILNGLEIMKVMNSSGAFIVVASSGSKSNLGIILGAVFGAIAALILVVVAILLIRRRKIATKQHSKTWVPFSVNGMTTNSVGSRVSNGTTATSGQNANLGYRFSFTVIQEATNNFDENWVIGVGGFGKVYKGVLRDDTKVAVKRGNPKSQQGLNEFRTEIELLSRLRHRHLVSLIGFCDEGNEMILVYEYMEKGSLKSHLYNSDLPNLSWKQRLEICIGSARGLHYLHTGSAKAIIHRDVKSANILLDETLLAKVADFGLSKTGPELDQTHVSTAVKGSFGYLDPEYFRRQQLTDKSDVYSFGVVLLEVLCARPVIDPTLPREMVNLAEWGMKWLKRGELDQIVDARIAGSIKPDSLRKFGETVEKCLADYGVERPTMGDVLWNLEYALQLQEVDSSVSEVNSINRIVELSSQVENIGTLQSVRVEGNVDGSTNDDLSEISMSRVFSQLIKSEGR